VRLLFFFFFFCPFPPFCLLSTAECVTVFYTALAAGDERWVGRPFTEESAKIALGVGEESEALRFEALAHFVAEESI